MKKYTVVYYVGTYLYSLIGGIILNGSINYYKYIN